MSDVFLNELGLICALGQGKASIAQRLFAQQPSGVALNTSWFAERQLHLGAVTETLPSVAALPLSLQSRNNALLAAALAEIRPQVAMAMERYGATRIGIVLGTSTSGILEGELAMAERQKTGQFPAHFHYAQQELGSPAQALAQWLGIAGPAQVISTACSSSAKALASAARLLKAGLCDAVLAGGVDSLCGFTIAGFSALDSVSAARCNPMSRHRCGINIGEGAALFLMTREAGPVRLSGWGETSDAHHISAPEPSGQGAKTAIQQALTKAGLFPAAIDYVNLHGTATIQNDAMESRAVADIFGTTVPASSTKPLTGHTLGAAGAIEAAFAWLTLAQNPQNLLPPHWWDGVADPSLPVLNLVAPGTRLDQPAQHILSNSFAFGGSNACLILSRGQ